MGYHWNLIIVDFQHIFCLLSGLRHAISFQYVAICRIFPWQYLWLPLCIPLSRVTHHVSSLVTSTVATAKTDTTCKNHKQCQQWYCHYQSIDPILQAADNKTLQWRHNGCDGVSDHQLHDCLLNRLFRRRSKKTSKLRVTGLCAGNSPGTGEFHAQMASNAANVSIRHHGKVRLVTFETHSWAERLDWSLLSMAFIYLADELFTARSREVSKPRSWDVMMIISRCKLTGISAALLPVRLSNFRAICKKGLNQNLTASKLRLILG